MLRRGLLFLSNQAWLRRWMEHGRVSKRLIRRFVAGESLPDAIAVCRRLQSERISATLDHLGENVTSEAEAAESLRAAVEAVHRIGTERLPATVSIKLTHFGLDLATELCRNNVTTLVERALRADTKVEIDMESSQYTERTLDLAMELHSRFGNVRAVIQAYLIRSALDVDRLCRQKVPVRLCKGAYLEPPEIAFQEKGKVDENYVALMKKLLRDGAYPAVATHDAAIIDEAIAFTRGEGIGTDRFEFQMLYGIRRDLQRKLVRKGYRLRLYVPYGRAWYPYFMRRLAERPANLWFVIKGIVN